MAVPPSTLGFGIFNMVNSYQTINIVSLLLGHVPMTICRAKYWL